jgi:cytochrome oxidase Cu insertion factor (SCO1/SenC/PrrC family)
MRTPVGRLLAVVVVIAVVYGGFVLWRAYQAAIGQSQRAVVNRVTLEPGPRPLTGLEQYPLIERSGANFKFDRLAGHVWVADVFFTACPHECKMLTAQLRGLQNDFSDLRLVSVTCDPDNDTPEKLRQYADENGALTGRWFFLTGKMYDIQGVCQELFGHAPKGIEHSRRVAVIDREGRWHGMYDVFEEKDMSDMRGLITRLLSGAGEPSRPRARQSSRPPEPPSHADAS